MALLTVNWVNGQFNENTFNVMKFEVSHCYTYNYSSNTHTHTHTRTHAMTYTGAAMNEVIQRESVRGNCCVCTSLHD